MGGWGTFSNIKYWVEHQTRNQTLRKQRVFSFVFSVKLELRPKPLIKAKTKIKKEYKGTEQLNCDDKDGVLPKASRTKNVT